MIGAALALALLASGSGGAPEAAAELTFVDCVMDSGGPVFPFGFSRSQRIVALGAGDDLERQAALFDEHGFQAVGSTSEGDVAFFLSFDEAGLTMTMRDFKPTAEEVADLLRDNNSDAGQRRLVPRYAGRTADETYVLTCTRKQG